MEIKNTFVGGRMSKDVNERLVTPDLYNNAENIRILNSVSGDAGVVSNVLGNTKLTNFNLANGKTIGAFADNSNSKLYSFMTSDTKDMVVEYDDVLKITVVLLEASKPNTSLNFNKAYLITGVAKVINGNPEKDLLVWTDDLNSVKIINIKRSKEYGVDGFTEEDISLIKSPPSYPPTATMLSRNLGTNDLADKYVAFSYRYKYKDGFTSALAPFTEYQFTPLAAGFDHDYDTNEDSSMTNLYDTIQVSFSTGGENVEGIDVVFKESGSNNVNIIKSFNKSNAGFDDNTTQSLYFSTVKGYTLLPEDELFRVFDNVPIRAKALEMIGSRLCFGNYVEGYDMVTADGTSTDVSITTTLLSGASASYNRNSVKTLRWYDLGLVYLDKFGRRSTVQTSSFADDQFNSIFVGVASSHQQNKLQVTIHNPAPYWADRYQIVVRERTESFHNIFIDGSKIYEDTTYRYCMLEGENKNKVQEGDRLYVKIDTVGRITTSVEAVVLEVATKEQDFITGALPGLYMKLQPSGYTLTRNGTPGGDVAVFETKPLESNLDIYYETGDMYPIINGYHQGNVQSQSSINTTAIVTSKFFNCFTMGLGVESVRYLDRFTGNLLKNDLIPNSTSSDAYQEIRRFCDLTYSEVYNESTNLNGLNEFNLSKANFKEDIDKKYGSIQKLFSRDSDLMVFQEDKVSKVLYGKNLLMNADGSSNVSATDDVLGQQVMYAGEYGISKEPESFAVFGNRVYNTDTKRGVVLRTSIDGVTEIVNGMSHFFRDLFIITDGTNKYGAYDPYNDQYVLAVDSEKELTSHELTEGIDFNLNNYSGTDTLVFNFGKQEGNFYYLATSNGKPVRYVTTFNGVTTDSGYLGDSVYNDELVLLGLPPVSGGKDYSYSSGYKANSDNEVTTIEFHAPLCDTSIKIYGIRTVKPMISVVPFIIGDTADYSKNLTLRYQWLHDDYKGESKIIPVVNGVANPLFIEYDMGNMGEKNYPPKSSLITFSLTETIGDDVFVISNRLGYYFNNTDVKYSTVVDVATYVTAQVTTTDTTKTSSITFTASPIYLPYLYLVVDLQNAYYNAEVSTTLRKNSCTPPLVGSFVTYTVPEATYTSPVSQAAADALAANDIATNAQTYANTNGACLDELSITSSIPASDEGTLDFLGGDPNEVIGLHFLFEYNVAGEINFSDEINVSLIDSLHTVRTGTTTLDSSGQISATYYISPNCKCTVTITSRTGSNPLPAVTSTVIDNM